MKGARACHTKTLTIGAESIRIVLDMLFQSTEI